MTGDSVEVPPELRSKIDAGGLEFDLRHLDTPGQFAFAAPVRGLDYRQARLLRDGRLVVHGEGVTIEDAVRAALRAL